MENGWMDWIEWMWKVDSGKWKVESGKWKVARFRISHIIDRLYILHLGFPTLK